MVFLYCVMCRLFDNRRQTRECAHTVRIRLILPNASRSGPTPCMCRLSGPSRVHALLVHRTGRAERQKTESECTVWAGIANRTPRIRHNENRRKTAAST